MYELYIVNKDKIYTPLIEGDIKYTTEISGVPGKLTFNVLKDDVIDFQEGNAVIFRVNDTDIFYGFVFAKERDKEQIITVTAYDQLRYLKSKDSCIYKNKTATEVVKMIADRFQLKTGELDNTEYVITKRIEDNATLFDIILYAVNQTLLEKKKSYVLFDSFGKLSLKNIENMLIPSDLVIGDNTAVNYSYKTDIDSDTYNQIKLVKDNDKTGEQEHYVIKDSETINDWGVLQYCEKANKDMNAAQIKELAAQILSLKNRKSRSLAVKDNIGDIRARSGKSIMTVIESIGEISVAQYLIIDKCEHVFRNDEHFMNLDLRGNL